MTRMRGFTLIELAVAFLVIALLLGMMVIPLNTQIDQHRINETQKQANVIVEAILGFAVANGRLPCPAAPTTANTTAGAGVENKPPLPATACGITEGVVPWATLGVQETDTWGRRFTYRVTPMFADDPAGGLQASFGLADNGNINVTSGGAAPVNIAANMAAIVVSHGKNGLGGYQPNGVQLVGAAADEAENANANMTFISKIHEPTFDDLLVWVSPSVLKARMVAANRIP